MVRGDKISESSLRNPDMDNDSWIKAKEDFLQYLHSFEDKDKKRIAFGKKILSVNDVLKEIADDTETARQLIRIWVDDES